MKLGGYSLVVQAIDARNSPRQVWISLLKDGVTKADAIYTAGQTFNYLNSGPVYTIFSARIDSIFAGATNDMVQLRENSMASIVLNSLTTPTMTPLQNQYSSSKKTLIAGETWNITGRFKLIAQAIDVRTSPRTVWLVLLDNCRKVSDQVVSQGQYFTYSNIFKAYVDTIFAGATSDLPAIWCS